MMFSDGVLTSDFERDERLNLHFSVCAAVPQNHDPEVLINDDVTILCEESSQRSRSSS